MCWVIYLARYEGDRRVRLRSIRSRLNDMWGTEVVSGLAGVREEMVIKYGRPMWEVRSEKRRFIKLVIRQKGDAIESPLYTFTCQPALPKVLRLFLYPLTYLLT